MNAEDIKIGIDIDEIFQMQRSLQVLCCNGILSARAFNTAHKNLQEYARKRGIYSSYDDKQRKMRVRT